jgi:hypothetical protein
VRRVAAAVAALALAACTRDATPPVATPPVATPPVATPSPLPALPILDVADLPPGYVLDREFPPHRDPVEPRPSPPECAQSTAPAAGFAVERVRMFAAGERRITVSVRAHDTVERATRDLRSMYPHPDCPTVTARAPGQPDVVSRARRPIDVPEVGDESFGIRAREAATLALFFRSGTVVVTVSLVEVPSERLLVALAGAQLARLRSG